MSSDSILSGAPDQKFPFRRTSVPQFWCGGIAECDVTQGEAPAGVGLSHGHLHEFYSLDPDDAAAATGLVASIAIASVGTTGPVAWLGQHRYQAARGVIQGAGWAELGGLPGACLFVLAEDAACLLRASVDVVRSASAGVVIIESRGRMPELDLTASRRLSLAAERSGVLLIVLRSDASPVPSAGETRWSVASAPSRALPANAPGMPAFDIELLRHRSGPAGGRWRLEWDRDRRIFRDATVSGAVVPVPVSGTPADAGKRLPGFRVRHAA